MRLVRRQSQILQLGLAVAGGQPAGALKPAGIVMPVDQVQYGLARGSRHGPEGDGDSLAARDQHPPPDAEDGIEHRADGVGEGPAFENRPARCPTRDCGPGICRDRFHALDVAVGTAFQHADMGGPRPVSPCPSAAGARPARRRSRAYIRFRRTFWRRRVGGLIHRARQRQLDIGRDLDLAQARAGIGDGNAPNLRILLRRDADFRQRDQGAIGALEAGAVFREAAS